MREPAVAMIVRVVMRMTLAVIMMMVVLVCRFEEMRLDGENALEVERIALQHFSNRQRAALRAVQPRIRIDGPDTRYDLTQLRVRDEIGLVDQDHISECDLVLGLRRVAQAIFQP